MLCLNLLILFGTFFVFFFLFLMYLVSELSWCAIHRDSQFSPNTTVFNSPPAATAAGDTACWHPSAHLHFTLQDFRDSLTLWTRPWRGLSLSQKRRRRAHGDRRGPGVRTFQGQTGWRLKMIDLDVNEEILSYACIPGK